MKKTSYFDVFQRGNGHARRRQGRNGMNEHTKIDGMIMDFNELITSLSRINEDLREQSIRAVNTSLTMRNWFFGFYILEFEQHGKDRANYGEALLANISKEMKSHSISGAEERELRRYRQFYLTYPAAGSLLINELRIRETLSPELLASQKMIEESSIRGPLDSKLFLNQKSIDDPSIRGSLTPELKNQEETDSSSIRESVTPELQLFDSHSINLFNLLSFTHFVELIRLDDSMQRLFYELECIKGSWSIRELKRQIGSLLYERTGLSKNKEKLLAMVQTAPATSTIADTIRDPYIFEFLGLKQQEVLPEKELEQALLDHLQQFLLELGKGFCFEARQKRITVDQEHYFIDMVFYHRLLHCNVLVELKTGRFNHAHASQLNMYLEYYKRYEIAEGDQPPVGILLCTGKDQEYVEFATAGLDDKVFVAKYLVALPGKKELEQFIKNELKKGNTA